MQKCQGKNRVKMGQQLPHSWTAKTLKNWVAIKSVPRVLYKG